MDNDTKDLAAVFEEQKTKIEVLEGKITAFEEKLNDLPSAEQIQGLLTAIEQRKPYGKPYGEPFINSVVALIEKVGAKTIGELKEKLKAMTTEELEQIGELAEFIKLIGETSYEEFMKKCMEGGKSMAECAKEYKGEPKEDEAGEQEHPTPDIGKTLRYLRGKLDAEAFKHVLPLFGIEKEISEEDLLKLLGSPTLEDRLVALEQKTSVQPLYALPTGELTDDKEAFLAQARKDWGLGLEHQEVE